ncbi:SPOR domain-containing protein [Chitinimonas sp. BJYL2]|uniref:SPOR domain-containing protein n=1 Tax=Chitinimonas sp. BJYL2 TaxID=2976696 RepID=UPI0022B3397A|nr:SPOR domain-containing protein [Chitinimonas sp. BJYL2]
MKWLFLLLILANLLFFGYTRLVEPPPPVDWQSRLVKAEQVRIVVPAPPKVATTPELTPPGTEDAFPDTPVPDEIPVDAAATPPALACFDWRGVLPEDLPNVRKQLAALKLGGEIKVQAAEPDSPKRYWVFIPQRPNLADAQKKADELKALGVEDFFVVNDGSRWNHAISLGLFSSEEAAKRRLDVIRGKGVRSAIVRERGDTQGKIVQIRQVPASAKAALSKAATGFKGSSVTAVDC